MFKALISLFLITTLGIPNAEVKTPEKPFKSSTLLEVAIIPRLKAGSTQPVIEAKSALLVDVKTGTVLFKKNPDHQRAMASLTKIMTAILILENHKMNEIVTIQDDFNTFSELGVRMWLQQYEKITVGDLLMGLLIPSAGDAAMALAVYHSGSVEKFVNAMNKRTISLHLLNTHFKNPIGLDEDGHYSTAADLGVLTRYALRFPEFRRIIRLSEALVTSTNGKITHKLKNTDELLGGYLNIYGVKTGTTDGAGESVINLAQNSNGHEVLSIILDSPHRFQESKSLIDWSFRNFIW